MLRYILIAILFFNSIAFSCSLCAMSAPRTNIGIKIDTDKEKIKSAKITWSFTKDFTQELLNLYDLNLDKQFDQKELKFIENAMLNYVAPRNFLTTISYAKMINKKAKKLEVVDYKTYFKNGEIFFEYDVKLDYKIVDKHKLYIKIHDNEAYFSMLFDNKKQIINTPYKVQKTIKPNSIQYTISKS